MDKRVLSDLQLDLLPLLKQFSNSFGLVGGTAVALLLGHRRSIDFDLFTDEKLNHDSIRKTIRGAFSIDSVIVDQPQELTLVAHRVKLTFLSYPFPLTFTEQLDDVISLPDVVTLAAMKAFALGKRAKWKDYVDLYFILKSRTLTDVTARAIALFGNEFNEKLFREQLSYFDDIDYSETIDYMKGFEVSDEEIKKTLQKIAIQR